MNVDTTNSTVGIGTTSPSSSAGDILFMVNPASDFPTIAAIENYSANSYLAGAVFFRKSNSNTKGTKTTTVDGMELSRILTYGVGSDNQWGTASEIVSIQDGSVGVGGFYIPTRMELRVTDGINSPAAAILIKPSGYVGIGSTTSPVAQLDVKPGAEGIVALNVNNPSNPGEGTDIARFQLNGTTKVVIDKYGAVGIGTSSVSSPYVMLEVKGKIKASWDSGNYYCNLNIPVVDSNPTYQSEGDIWLYKSGSNYYLRAYVNGGVRSVQLS